MILWRWALSALRGRTGAGVGILAVLMAMALARYHWVAQDRERQKADVVELRQQLAQAMRAAEIEAENRARSQEALVTHRAETAAARAALERYRRAHREAAAKRWVERPLPPSEIDRLCQALPGLRDCAAREGT